MQINLLANYAIIYLRIVQNERIGLTQSNIASFITIEIWYMLVSVYSVVIDNVEYTHNQQKPVNVSYTCCYIYAKWKM